jgi:hypothetical protein
LHSDVSYAVEAAAAKELGKSDAARSFEVLQAEAATEPEVDVMDATLEGLASVKDPRAVTILLAQARPGVPERSRLTALMALEEVKPEFRQDHSQELADVVRLALHDPFFLIQDAGEELAGALKLSEFEPQIQSEAQGAPTIMQRDIAQKVLEQLHQKQ